MAKLSAVFVLALLVGNAFSWYSKLYPQDWEPGFEVDGKFLHDFSYAGYKRGEVEIPTEMEGAYVDVTKSPYNADNTGAEDATEAIQSAIEEVENQGGGTVYLPEGTYKVKPVGSAQHALLIKKSNVLFKGAGKGKTFIRGFKDNMRSSTIIQVKPDKTCSWDNDSGTIYKLSHDVTDKDTSVLYLSNTDGLKKGDWVIVRTDRTDDWIDDMDMGGYWSTDYNYAVTFYRQITAVDSEDNTITIDIPTKYAMKKRDNARVYKCASNLENVGLQDFSIGNKEYPQKPGSDGFGEEDYKTSGTAAYKVHSSFLISFSFAVNSWAKNIASYKAGNTYEVHMQSNGLNLNRCRSLTIEKCDFSHPQYEGGGGNGYGINICSEDCLIKDCSSTSARHSFSFKYGFSNGNVIYHYTSTDPKYGSDFHMYLSYSNLIDNEELNGDFVESVIRPYGGTAGNYHGYSSSQTVFWNTKGNYYKDGKDYVVDSRQYGYGYIIGTQGEAYKVKTTPTYISTKYGDNDSSPEDYKEGIGEAEDLEPQSLYYDQLERRLGK
ncbi:MAG: hypothetical protein MJ209_07845 [archaeon]|nr:hypothetical protein [archaeon]